MESANFPLFVPLRFPKNSPNKTVSYRANNYESPFGVRRGSHQLIKRRTGKEFIFDLSSQAAQPRRLLIEGRCAFPTAPPRTILGRLLPVRKIPRRVREPARCRVVSPWPQRCSPLQPLRQKNLSRIQLVVDRLFASHRANVVDRSVTGYEDPRASILGCHFRRATSSSLQNENRTPLNIFANCATQAISQLMDRSLQ